MLIGSVPQEVKDIRRIYNTLRNLKGVVCVLVNTLTSRATIRGEICTQDAVLALRKVGYTSKACSAYADANVLRITSNDHVQELGYIADAR
jgi:hypothetical protein